MDRSVLQEAAGRIGVGGAGAQAFGRGEILA
jgi:hypothetical protein